MNIIIRKVFYSLSSLLIILGILAFSPAEFNPKLPNSDPAEIYESDYFSRKNIVDGPYIFYEKNKPVVKWIYKNFLMEKKIKKDDYSIIKRKFGFEFNPQWIEQLHHDSIDYLQSFDQVDHLIAISDVHGQYEVLVELLQQHKVIDRDFNWIYGKGHLVVLGDILDRGPQVTESLWLIFRLEQQAKVAGGMVHVLLGNHELMVLNNDIRYIHNKYIQSAKLMTTTYDQLFAANTFLGQWLRKKPVMVSINDMLFVHAGISTEFVDRGITVEKANTLFINQIIGKSWDTILSDSTLSFMSSKNGPVWFRGYFINERLNELQIDQILEHFNKKIILVGHTSLPNITTLYHGKVFGIDSSIKEGDYGELLIYEKGTFYRGTLHGGRIGF